MKEIKATALFLWLFIFIVCAFLAGQYLSQKGIYNVFGLTEKDTEDTVSQEEETTTKGISINKQFAQSYFSKDCEGFVKYLLSENKEIAKEKTEITEDYMLGYVFYAVSNGLETDEYELQNVEKDDIIVTEAEINGFADKKFGKELPKTIKDDETYGYNSEEKTYTIKESKSNSSKNISCSATNIENLDDEVAITFTSGSKKIIVYLQYSNGNYVMTALERK